MPLRPSIMALVYKGGGIPAEPILDGPYNGHGPHTVQETGGQESFHKGLRPCISLSLGFLDPGRQPGAHLFQFLFDPQGFPQDGSGDQTDDGQQDVLSLEGHLKPQQDHAESQTVNHRFLVFFLDAPAHQQAHQAAAGNGGHIHKGSRSDHGSPHTVNSPVFFRFPDRTGPWSSS